MSRKIDSMTFFTDHCAKNFFFIAESVYFHSIDYLFDPDMFCSFENNSFD